MTLLRTACQTVRPMDRLLWVSSACCSREDANSNTMVAAVSNTRACTEIKVNSVTSPCSPKARPTSGTPIMAALLNMLANPRAAARVLKP